MEPYHRLIYEHLLAGRDKQDRLLEAVGHCAWNFDLARGEVRFVEKKFLRSKTHVAKVQLLGSYSHESGSWLWAWGNPQALPEELLEVARRLKALGEREGIEVLAERYLGIDEDFVHGLASVASGVGAANGYYRCPNGAGAVWVLLYGDFVPAPERPLARVCSRYPAEIAELAADLPDAALALEHYLRFYGFSVERASGTLTATSATGESLTATFDDEGRFRELKAKL
jgi:hypothetical protein